MFDDVRDQDRANRAVREFREAVRDAGELDVEASGPEVGHRTLIRVEASRLDSRFAAECEKLAAAAAGVENGFIFEIAEAGDCVEARGLGRGSGPEERGEAGAVTIGGIEVGG